MRSPFKLSPEILNNSAPHIYQKILLKNIKSFFISLPQISFAMFVQDWQELFMRREKVTWPLNDKQNIGRREREKFVRLID